MSDQEWVTVSVIANFVSAACMMVAARSAYKTTMYAVEIIRKFTYIGFRDGHLESYIEGVPPDKWLLEHRDDGRKIYLDSYAGGASSDGEWSKLTLSVVRPGTADVIWHYDRVLEGHRDVTATGRGP